MVGRRRSASRRDHRCRPARRRVQPTAGPTGFQALVADINALPAVQNPQPFLAKALAAREAALRGQPCVAANQLGALRNQVAAKFGKKGIPDETWGRIDADAVRVLIGLLQAPDAAACGGTTVPAAGGAEPQVEVVSSDAGGLTLHVAFPQPTFTPRLGDGQVYLDMAMDGLGSPGSVGKPNVPALTRFFALPIGADASVDLLGSSSYVLDGIRLWPQQDEAADPTAVEFGTPPFVINRESYSSNVAYPASPVGVAPLGTLRDLRLGGVEADGAQYNPVTQSVRVYTGLDLRVNFGGDGNTKVFGDSRMTSLWNLGAQRTYDSSLLNYAVARANIDLSSRFVFCGEEYLIVTTHALEPAADSLATHRNADGISTQVVTLGAGEGDIGTTKEQIQSYIRGQLTNGCLIRPSYVGILGDTTQVPTWKPSSPWGGTGFDGLIASDLPYALANSADLLPDLAIGRMPAPNLAVANDEVAKIVAYEDSPPIFAGDFYNHATVTSYFQCGLDAGGQPCSPGTRDERTFSKLSETVRNGLLAAGKTVDRVYTTTAVTPQQYYDGTALPAAVLKPGFAWNGTGADVTSDWNAGRFLILHRDHGNPGGWGNPNFGTGNIAGLTNGAKLPVVFSINCASGKFDDASPNFSEQLVEKASGGAVGVIGDSRNSPSNTNSHLAAGLIDAIFPATLGAYGSATPLLRMGDVLVAGKQYMNTQNGLDGQDNSTTQAEEYLYHWFGDPTMPIWRSQPSIRFTGVLSASVFANAVLLSVSDGSAEGAVATLYANDQAVGRALVKDGVATIVPEGPSPLPIPYPNTDAIFNAPTLTVVVDQDGFVPAQVTLEQAPPPIG
jgi:Peptidase family C25/Propeptide_C25